MLFLLQSRQAVSSLLHRQFYVSLTFLIELFKDSIVDTWERLREKMKAIVIVLSALIVVGTSASISEPEGVVASAQKSWFEKAIDSIESTFKGES